MFLRSHNQGTNIFLKKMMGILHKKNILHQFNHTLKSQRQKNQIEHQKYTKDSDDCTRSDLHRQNVTNNDLLYMTICKMSNRESETYMFASKTIVKGIK